MAKIGSKPPTKKDNVFPIRKNNKNTLDKVLTYLAIGLSVIAILKSYSLI